MYHVEQRTAMSPCTVPRGTLCQLDQRKLAPTLMKNRHTGSSPKERHTPRLLAQAPPEGRKQLGPARTAQELGHIRCAAPYQELSTQPDPVSPRRPGPGFYQNQADAGGLMWTLASFRNSS